MKCLVIQFGLATMIMVTIALLVVRRETRSTLEDTAALQAEQKLKAAEARAKAAEARANAADADTAQLLAAVESAARSKAVHKAPTVRITRAMLDAKLRQAKELRKTGDLKGSFELLQWIFEDGSRSVSSYLLGRNFLVLPELGELAKNYTPARRYMEETGAKAAKRFIDDVEDRDSLGLYLQIKRELNVASAILNFVDQFGPDDPHRAEVIRRASTEFIEAQRYDEVVKTIGLEEMIRKFERWSIPPDFSRAPNPAAAVAGHRAAAISTTVKDIEALAGSGRMADAVALAGKLVLFDNRPETLALIQKHALRAGVHDFPIGVPSTSSPGKNND